MTILNFMDSKKHFLANIFSVCLFWPVTSYSRQRLLTKTWLYSINQWCANTLVYVIDAFWSKHTSHTVRALARRSLSFSPTIYIASVLLWSMCIYPLFQKPLLRKLYLRPISVACSVSAPDRILWSVSRKKRTHTPRTT